MTFLLLAYVLVGCVGMVASSEEKWAAFFATMTLSALLLIPVAWVIGIR
jgi:hypothetical protein